MNKLNAIQQAMLANFAGMIERINSASTGKLISTMTIDPVTGSLLVLYSGETEPVDLGRVIGGDGDDGISITDVQLFEDPEEAGAVFVETTLSNGVKLRTQNSLSGYNGHSVSDAYIQNNELHFVLDDGLGTELPPVPVSGLTAISVSGARIENGELIFTLTDNTEINAGVATDLQGRGVSNVRLEAGKLQFQYSDAPTVWVDVGSLDGVDSISFEDGILKYAKSSDPATKIALGPVVSITGALVEGNELKFTTNQLDEQSQPVVINVGPVANLKGDTGVGVSAVEIVDNVMKITLTDNSILDVPVTGLTPISVTGARYDEVEQLLYLTLSNDTEISTGIKEDLRGRGIVNAEVLADGDLQLYFSDDPTTPVTVASIKYPVAFTNHDGKLYVKYNTAPTEEVEVGTLLGLTSLAIQGGKFVVTYTDGSTAEIGSARAIQSMAIDGSYNLVVTYTDGTQENVGNLPEGPRGVGYNSAIVDPATGDLIFTTTDNQQVNAGQVRMDIDNMIGSIKSFIASADQTEYIIDHSGVALCWKDGVIQDDSTMNFDLADRIVFNEPFVGGERVNIIAFAPTGTVITGKGIKSITQPSIGVYSIELENGQTFEINTVTEIDISTLPPGIKSMTINPSGNLIVTLTNDAVVDAGLVNQSNNVVDARVDQSGNLIITLTDETELNAGSVMSNLAISNVTINELGELIITMNSGGEFNAGPTGVYVTAASIDPGTGHLSITLSDARVLDAGKIVNPLLGTITPVVAFEGQTDFPIAHGDYNLLVYANSALLSEDSLILDDPLKVVTKVARKEGDLMRFILMSKGTIRAVGIEGEELAEDHTYYGKVGGIMGFHPIGSQMVGVPYDFVAVQDQQIFNNVEHSGSVIVVVNGVVRQAGVDASVPRRVTLTPGVNENDLVKIISLTAPSPMGSFLPTAHLVVVNDVFQNGGTAVADKYLQRQLNLMPVNNLGAILSNNRVVLPAGTYYVEGYSVFNNVAAAVIDLYETISSKPVLVGGGDYIEGQGKCFIKGYFTLAKQSALLLRYKCAKGVPSFGLGKVGDGTANAAAKQQQLGVAARLTELQFWKVE